MIGVRAKLRAGFCMSRRTVAHVCARSPIQPYKKSGSLIQADEKTEFSSKNSAEMSFNSGGSKPESECGNNRVMVVVDQSLEAKGALQWALSHTVQSQDTVILLHVTKPSKQGSTSFSVLSDCEYKYCCLTYFSFVNRNRWKHQQ